MALQEIFLFLLLLFFFICLPVYLCGRKLRLAISDKLKCFTESGIGSIDIFIPDLLYSIQFCGNQKDNDFIQTVQLGFLKIIHMKYLQGTLFHEIFVSL